MMKASLLVAVTAAIVIPPACSAPIPSNGLRGLQFDDGCDPVTVDFTPFERGDVIDESEKFPGGIVIKARKFYDSDGNFDDGMIFDVLRISGGGEDLGNFKFLGKMLIISEDNNPADPNAAAKGGQVKVEFPEDVTIHSIRFIDVQNVENGDQGKSELGLFDKDGVKVRGVKIPGMLSGGQKVLSFSERKMGLRSIMINVRGSGAIDDIVYSPDNDCAPSAKFDESEICCDPSHLRLGDFKDNIGCGAEEYLQYDAPTSFCCPDGKWVCIEESINGARAVCSDKNSPFGTTEFTDDGRGPVPFFSQQGPICGGCKSLSDAEIKELGLMCGPGRECPREGKTCTDGSLVFRDPRHRCEFRHCPEEQVPVCCNPAKEPRGGRWAGNSSPGDCPDGGSLCCPDGNWTCFDVLSPDGLSGSTRCRSPFSGVPVVRQRISSRDRGEVCENPCPQDTKRCPNTWAEVVRDPLNNCEFLPCPENAMCCDPLKEPHRFGNPGCPEADQYQVSHACCPNGQWTCTMNFVDALSPAIGTTPCEGFGDLAQPTGILCEEKAEDCETLSSEERVDGCTITGFFIRRVLYAVRRSNLNDKDVFSLAFNRDASRLANVARGLRIWDTDPALKSDPTQPIADLMDRGMWSVRYSPDFKLLASGNIEGFVRIYDATDLENGAVTDPIVTLRGHDYGALTALSWHPTGTMLASGGGDGQIILWNVLDNRLIKRFRSDYSYVLSVSFSPDGEQLVSAGQTVSRSLGRVYVWDTSTGDIVNELSEFSEEDSPLPRSAEYSPDGTIIATASVDRWVRVFDAATGSFLYRLNRGVEDPDSPGNEIPIIPKSSEVSFSPKGKYLATGHDDGRVRVWNPYNGTSEPLLLLKSDPDLRIGFRRAVRSVGWSPDGKYLAAGSREVETVIFGIAEEG